MNHPNRKKILFTLQSIRDAGPCETGWIKLRKALPPKTPLSALISLGDVAAANDAADALWCVCVLDWSDLAVRRRVIGSVVLLAASRAVVNTTDKRVADCIDAVKRWCEGDNSVDLSAAESAAESAAWSARSARSAWSAWSAWSAESAAWSAESAAWSARSAAWSARSAEQESQRNDIVKAFKPVLVTLR